MYNLSFLQVKNACPCIYHHFFPTKITRGVLSGGFTTMDGGTCWNNKAGMGKKSQLTLTRRLLLLG